MWHNNFLKMHFYSLRKFKNKCFKIRNKSADCSKNINLMSKISLQYALSCGIVISSKRIFIHYVNSKINVLKFVINQMIALKI